MGLLHAELYNRDQAISSLTKSIPSLTQLKADILYIAHLLLADILQQQQKYEDAIKHCDVVLQLIRSWKERDRVLETEIELARSDCAIETNPDNTISHLQEVRSLLNTNDSDTQRVCLQAIVYDILAKYCLKQENYELFDRIAEESMALKLRHFSQYHPSLAINLVLIAERLIQLLRYREALDFYEHALEVQSLNLTDNHPKIRKICYAMGDIYCKLDKLANATEKYDVAESKSLESDNDIVFRDGKMNSKESIDIYMARIRMHQHLADYHAKKQNYKDCISEMYEIHDLLEKKLPSAVFNDNDDTSLIQNNIDPTTLTNNLQQLVNCYLNRDISYDSEDDDQNSYTIALDISQKLNQYDRKSAKRQLFLVYQKLSRYYEDLQEDEDALDYLQKTINFETPTISTLYRLAYLNANCDKLDEAIINYENLLNNESVKDQSELSKIIQEKLEKVKRKVKKARRRSSSTPLSSTDDHISDQETSDNSTVGRLSRNPTNISITSHTGNENKNTG